MSNATRNVEIQISARRALWDAEMEESASHHVNICFLLRLRRQNQDFSTRRVSQIHICMDFCMLQKMKNNEDVIINGISFEINSGGLVAATQNWKQIREVEDKTKLSVIAHRKLY